MKNYLISFITAFIISFFLTPVIKRIAVRWGLVAEPREDRWHKKETALFGGVAIFISFIIPYFIFVKPTFETIGIIVCGGLIFGLGLFDDIVHIKPYTKLIGQIIVASLLVSFGVSIKVIPYPVVGIPLTILWVVAIVNAFNLIDNMDGLSGGVAVIVSGILVVFTFLKGNFQVILPSLILAGSLLGFLRYNFSPARIFMGDCGSMFTGFMLGTITLLGSWEEPTHLIAVLGIPVLVLAVPIFDTAFVTFMRGISSRRVFQGGMDHISHRMVVLGLSEKKAVTILYIVSMFFGMISVFSVFVRPVVTLMLILIAGVSLVYLASFLGKVKVYPVEEIKDLKKKNGKVILNSILLYKRRLLEVAVDFILICVAYISAYLLRYEVLLTDSTQDIIIKSLPLIVIIKYIIFYRFGLYRGIWRYVGIPDLINIFKAVSFASVASAMCILLIWRFQGFSRAIFIVDWLLLFVLISGSRIIERVYKELFDQVGLKGKRVLIYGAGDAGEITLREIKNNKMLQYNPVGFLDDDVEKIHRRIHGIPVLGSGDDISRIVKRKEVDELIIAIPSLSKESVEEIIGLCRGLDIGYRRMQDILPR